MEAPCGRSCQLRCLRNKKVSLQILSYYIDTGEISQVSYSELRECCKQLFCAYMYMCAYCGERVRIVKYSSPAQL